METCQKEQQEEKNVELPFILNFLEEYKGAMSFTTSGTYDNCDAFDSQ